jgi:hypothetical protein
MHSALRQTSFHRFFAHHLNNPSSARKTREYLLFAGREKISKANMLRGEVYKQRAEVDGRKGCIKNS